MKNKVILIIVAIAFYSILFGMVVSDVFQKLFLLVFSNVFIDYFFEIYITSQKSINNLKFKDKFNSDYFDLYWHLSKNRLQLLLNIVLFLISFVSRGTDSAEIIRQFIFAVLLFVIGFAIWVGLLHVGKKQRVIFKLIEKKQQNYCEYTDEEIEILRELD